MMLVSNQFCSKKVFNSDFTTKDSNSKLTNMVSNISSLFSFKSKASFLTFSGKTNVIFGSAETSKWNDKSSNAEDILRMKDKAQVVLLIVFLPKEAIFRTCSSNKKNADVAILAIEYPKLMVSNAITSQTLHSVLTSPEVEANWQELISSMCKLHLNFNDLLFSPVGIKKPRNTKGSAPEGNAKGAIADSIHLMFIVLGWTGNKPARSIEIFDSFSQKWSYFQQETPFVRAYHGVALIGSHIYVVGGYDGRSCVSSTLCLNIRTRDWSRKSSMSVPRCYLFALVFREEIFAIGGHNGERRLKTCEKFDPKKNKWIRLRDMMYRRSDAAGAQINDKIIVTGGFDGFEFHPTAEIYDPANNQWSLVARLLNPRSGHCMINLDGHILALGGFNGVHRLKEVEVFNEENDRWETLVPMLEGRSNFCAALFQEDIYVIGGYDGVRTISSVEKFDKSTLEWLRVPSLNIHRSASGACVMNNEGSISSCRINELIPVVSPNTEESSP